MKRVAGWLIGALLLLTPALSNALEGLHLGDKAPAFSLADLSGAAQTLDALGARPRVILFWSTWSPRSLDVLRDFAVLHERWAAAGLAIVAVNADGEQLDASRMQAVRACVERLQLPFPVLLDGGLHTYAAYGVMALPSAVVVDAAGRIAYVLGGYPETLREELKDNIQLALGGGAPRDVAAAAPSAGAPALTPPEAEEPAAAPTSRCSIPRAFYCSMAAERQHAAADPAIVAVRLSICRGDAVEAERMLQGVSREAGQSVDLRFAQANLLLLKGQTTAARAAFGALLSTDPAAGWGEWGLGMMALAEGDPDRALGHLRAAAAGRGALPEAETAVLKYLEEFWRSRRPAPREEEFLALFQELDGVRACYRKLAARG
jgi:peroxiredoxin